VQSADPAANAPDLHNRSGKERPRASGTAGSRRSRTGDHIMMTLDDDLLAVGSCIAGLGILMTGLLALLFRHPNAPGWTRPEIVALLVCVPVTATTGFGLGYTAYGIAQLVNGTGDPRGLLVLGAVLIILTLAWRASGIRRRLKDYAAATGGISASAYLATEPTLAIDQEPSSRPQAHARRSGSAA
jgi:hypothetical protein